LSWPNIITVARIVSVPVIVWLIITGQWQAAFLLFIAAGVSDGIDGFLAKKFNRQTELGAYLDPIADKALLVSIYVALGIGGGLPSWLVILVVSRDILIVGAVMLSWMMDRPVRVAPLMVSKINTAAQIVLAGVVLAHLGYGIVPESLISLGTYVVAGFSVASVIAYLGEWFRHMANGDHPPERIE
jgi:cardiolipin synthase